MKKLLTILLSMTLIISGTLGLTACGGEKNGEANESKTTLFTLAYDDSVWNYSEDDMKNEEDDRLFYYDGRRPLPGWDVGQRLLLTSYDKLITDWETK